MPQTQFISLQGEIAAPETLRKVQFEGVEHLVVPIIALVEGVILTSNANEPELALAAEFASHPGAWNGRPVTLGHPQRNGQMVSAGSPDVIENEQIGLTFNAHRDGNKLKLEAWINLERIALLGLESDIARIEAGERVEVSTGLFTDVRVSSGVHNGKRFEGIWTNIKADHLAILPKGIEGACSWSDGCGAPRVNQKDEKKMTEQVICNNCSNKPCDCASIKTNTLAIDAKTVEIKPSEKLRNLFESLQSFFTGSKHLDPEMSDEDVRSAIEAALAIETPDSPDDSLFIRAVFENHFVFQKNFDEGIFRRDFAIDADGSVSLGDTLTQVRVETNFVDVQANKENDVMDLTEEKVDALIANSATKFTKEDKSWLKTLSTDQLDSMEPVAAKEDIVSEDGVVKVADVAAEIVPLRAVAETQIKPATVESFLQDAPEAIREVLDEGLRLQTAKKTELTAKLVAHSNNLFTAEQLAAKDISELTKLVTLAGVTVDYTGQSGPVALAATESVYADPMPKMFPAKTKD